MEEEHPSTTPFSHPFRWFPEFLEILHKRSRTQARLLALAMLVGVVAGLGAVAFSLACQLVLRFSLDAVAGYRAHGPHYEARVGWMPESNQDFHPWLLLLIPPIGGLISGWIVFRYAPEAEGHGTDSVIAAYHHKQGAMRGRVPLVKMVASAITLGTGGSGGREGPIAQIGAGFGSMIAKLLHMRVAERRILLASGMGAGIAAIFRAPLAGALFASEVLYRSPEFEPEVIMPAAISSVVAYSTFGIFFGWEPLFSTPTLVFDNPWQLVPYSLLAAAMALLAMIYTRTFALSGYLFKRMRLRRNLRPAIGAGLSGLIGVGLFYCLGRNPQVLSVLSFGYGVLQDAMEDPARLSVAVLAAVALGKILTTSLTIGSGGSGGVFGPSMVIGGCAGGALGLLFQRLWPNMHLQPVSFMIVGMAGFFAAAAKTPFSTLVMVCELTGDYRLIVPALWVCTLAFFLSDEQSLYDSQIESRNLSPAHQGSFVREALAGRCVAQVLSLAPAVEPLRPNESLQAVIERFSASPELILPVVGKDGKLEGIVNLHELYWSANRRDALPWLLAADLMHDGVKPLTPEDSLERAIELFAELDLPALPVVRTQDGQEYLAMVGRSDIAKLYLRSVQGEIRRQEAESGEYQRP
jgi:chloride channel protein, CIC family